MPNLNVARLKKDTLKKAVASELEALGRPSLPLTPMLREYVESLGLVHEEIRKLTARRCSRLGKDARRRAVERCREQFGGPDGRAFILEAIDANGNAIDYNDIFLEPVLYRQAFVRKNRSFVNLSKRFVSGANDAKGD